MPRKQFYVPSWAPYLSHKVKRNLYMCMKNKGAKQNKILSYCKPSQQIAVWVCDGVCVCVCVCGGGGGGGGSVALWFLNLANYHWTLISMDFGFESSSRPNLESTDCLHLKTRMLKPNFIPEARR